MFSRLGLLQKLAWPIASFFVLFSGECNDGNGGPTGAEGEPFDVDVLLVNDSDLPVHLFSPGEDFPCCRLDPGGSRQVTLRFGENARVEFRAGRNGEILDTVTCIARFDPENLDTGEHVTVSFDEAVGISCNSDWGPFFLRR